MDVKERLQTLMDERGWTIYKIAKEAEIPWSTVRNMFKRNTEPSITTLECICKGMGLSLNQFFDTENKAGLSESQQQLLSGWNKLNSKNQELILHLIEALNNES